MNRGPLRPSLGWQIAVVGLLTTFACYFVVPVLWLAISATKSTGDLFGSFGLWFATNNFVDNMQRVFSYDDGIFSRWALNSLIYSGVGAAAATLVSAWCGYALAKYEFRGKEAIFNVIIAGVLIPGTALALPLFLLFSKVGLANTYWAVLLPQIVSPFGVYLTRIYATTIPSSLLDAARIDGAGEARIFFAIASRLMTPALVTVFLFQFVGIWNNYFLPLIMLSDQHLYPITLGLTSWQSVADRNPQLYQLTVGGAFVSVIPLMLAILALQRFWRGGLTEGGVKQ